MRGQFAENRCEMIATRSQQACFGKMQTFQFKVLRNGEAWPEAAQHGVPSLAVARSTAAQLMADVVRDAVEEPWADVDWKVKVSDDNGVLMFAFTLVTASSPVAIVPRR